MRSRWVCATGASGWHLCHQAPPGGARPHRLFPARRRRRSNRCPAHVHTPAEGSHWAALTGNHWEEGPTLPWAGKAGGAGGWAGGEGILGRGRDESRGCAGSSGLTSPAHRPSCGGRGPPPGASHPAHATHDLSRQQGLACRPPQAAPGCRQQPAASHSTAQGSDSFICYLK